MREEYQLVLYILLCVIGMVAGMLGYHYYKKRNTFRNLRASFGQALEVVMGQEELQNCKQYQTLHPAKNCVDESTWDDLQMDTIFSHTNHTQSSIGDNYLYHYLHRQDIVTFDAFEQKVAYMKEQEDVRVNLQYQFLQIGKEEDELFLQYLLKGETIPLRSALLPFIILCLWIALVVATILVPTVMIDQGMIVAISSFLLVVSIFIFINIQASSKRMLRALRVFQNLLPSIENIRKLPIETFEEECTQIEQCYRKMPKNVRLFSKFALMSLDLDQNALLAAPCGILGIYSIAIWYLHTMFEKNREEILQFYQTIGYVETCIATASYRESLTSYCLPMPKDTWGIEVEDLYHPLLKQPVTNTKVLPQFSIITGANASGKTTFARAVAISLLLSQTLHFAYATSFSSRHLQLVSSIQISDSILLGDSYYVAEIKRVKSMMLQARDGKPTLLLLDELLKGTNTLERIAAASAILETLANYDVQVMLTTHDLELTEILKETYRNYHFKETTEEDKLRYDYKIYDGVSTGSNAIALLSVCGYEEDIVRIAQSKLKRYKDEEVWV